MLSLLGYFVTFLGLIGVSVCKVQDGQVEPTVAFHCGRPAMHLTEKGWVADYTTDCLAKPEEILDYCKKSFPTLDVRNYVESDHKITVGNWCDIFGENCNQSFAVRSFQCLIGPFTVTDLLVPDRCISDRKIDSRICQKSKDWKATAVDACHRNALSLINFSILQPCDVAQFSGVQYVCCPPNEDVSDQNSTDAKRQKPDHQSRVETEHERYVRVKSELQKHHNEEMAQIMDAWDSAQDEVNRMKAESPEMAEKLEKKITARFQKTISSLEERENAEKRQIDSVHDHNVQQELNAKKREAMELYMAVLSNRAVATLQDVYQALKHYVRTEQKDRMHVINHYQHLKNSDPSAAETIRSLAAEHLQTIQQRLVRAVGMLNRVPEYRDEIKRKIDAVLEEYQGFDDLEDSIIGVATSESPQFVSKKVEQELGNSSRADVIDTKPTNQVQSDESKNIAESKHNFLDDDGGDVEMKLVAHPNYLESNELRLEERNALVHKHAYPHSNVGPIVIIVATSIFVLTVTVLGIVVGRRYVETRRLRRLRKEDPRLLGSPEEVHISSMQVNGYENPTYKYYERKVLI